MEKLLSTPRQVKTQQTKKKVFDTAIKMMKKHGYEYVTVNNICSAAGISVGSFYHHFGNKDELLSYYFVESYEKYKHRYEEIQGDDVVANVVRIYDLYIEFCMEQGLGFIQSFYTPLNKSLDTRPKRGVDMAKGMPIMNQTILEIAKAKEQGHIRPEVDPDDFGFILCVLIKGCIFEWCVSDGEINLPAMSRKVLTGHMQSALTPEYFVRFPK